jgi:hypothetical protein
VYNMDKINTKTNKQGMVEYLEHIDQTDKRITKSLKDRIVYTLNAAKKSIQDVDRASLTDLINDISAVLVPVTAPAPIEGSLKPATKTEDKKTAPKLGSRKSNETPKEEAPAPEAPKADDKKKLGAKKPTVDSVPAASSVGKENLPSAKMFPTDIEHKDLGKLISCKGMLENYKDVVKALEGDITLYFACYWTKLHIKKYEYEASRRVKAPKEGFPFDLDLAVAVVPCENIERLYAMSMYTEAMFVFEGEDLEPVKSEDPRGGDTYSVRVSSGMEFEIYAPADDMKKLAKLLATK